MNAVIHIGPPKTGSSSIRESLIPHLGRPHHINPKWSRVLARASSFSPDVNLPADFVLSDEWLGDFQILPPHVIAERLSKVFQEATVIWVRRDPLSQFYSWYRQLLLNAAKRLADQVVLPHSPNDFFDREMGRYKAGGVGFFAMIDLDAISVAFRQYFDFKVLDFDLLKNDPVAFAAAFIAAAGGETVPSIGNANPYIEDRVEGLLRLTPDLPQMVIERYRRYYRDPALSEDRQAALNGIPLA